MITINEQIKAHANGLDASAVAFMIKGAVQVPVKALHLTDGATRAEAILQLLKDGWTAIPF
jgi:hypothetical protein